MVYINWPYLRRGRIISIETETSVITSKHGIVERDEDSKGSWEKLLSETLSNLRKKMAIQLEECSILVRVCPLEGWIQQGLDAVSERFGEEQVTPLQVILHFSFKYLININYI